MIFLLKRSALLLLVSAAALAGCNSGDSNGQKDGAEPQGGQQALVDKPVVSTEPVTLELYAYVARMTEDNFQNVIVKQVQKKYPHISVNLSFGGRGDLEKRIAAGTVPDIIFTANNIYPAVKMLDIPFDMTSSIKKFGIDLSKFDKEAVATIRDMEADKSMYAVPFSLNAGALFYNKDMFDRFGVPYPSDGMTWDQVIDISRTMTKQVDGVQYVGWDAGMPDAIAAPFGVSLVDPKTFKSTFNSPAYKKVFELQKAAWDMPGYLGQKGTDTRFSIAAFIGQKRVGMDAEWVSELLLPLADAEANGDAPNWDIATLPNFAEHAGKGRDLHAGFLLISKQSKYKDQAMQLIEVVTSKEAQLYMSRNGRMAALNDPQVIKEFGQDVPALRNKKVENIFKYPQSPAYVYTIYDNDILSIVRGIDKEIAVNNKDVNTALREAQEKADKMLDMLTNK
ncbi:hypothetical protein PAESOLCIP111_05163 [Paenibacillus solanacearum]|uniref:Extracellular solute-binding protein n=1 Tax=Paenibacillus solanacearum TaxID=2048548 RepID=A0A916K5N0_9BACL|nr:extracellular solute-binding protein [Paenibacillus solanacearum]CAG7646416.1 hypothetical protein PAESOLCIP111_05163 [Paenibacillus solanacearum]